MDIVDEVEKTVENTVKISIRIRDLILRIVLSIKNIFKCSHNCGSVKSSCCEKNDTHDT